MARNRGPGIEIIRPTGPITNFSKAKVVGRMRNLGLAIVRKAAAYPASKSSYRRTGTLGRSWSAPSPSVRGGDLVQEVGNPTEYAGVVMGLKTGKPKQSQRFQRLGWKSIQTIGEEEVGKARPGIVKALEGK